MHHSFLQTLSFRVVGSTFSHHLSQRCWGSRSECDYMEKHIPHAHSSCTANHASPDESRPIDPVPHPAAVAGRTQEGRLQGLVAEEHAVPLARQSSCEAHNLQPTLVRVSRHRDSFRSLYGCELEAPEFTPYAIPRDDAGRASHTDPA